MDGLEEGLCRAAWAGDLDELNRLLAAGADPNARLYDGTALSFAASKGHLHCIQVLLAAGADPDVFPSQMNEQPGGQTALMEAAFYGHQTIVAALLEAGAQPALDNGGGLEALYLAAHKGHVAVLRQLLAALPAEEQQKRMALSVAAALISGHVEVAHCLLTEGATAPVGEVLAVLRQHPAPAQPLYATLAARQPLTAEQWGRVPSPCPGLGTALPAVLQSSAQEAALLVRHLPAADRERLRAAALCLHCAQRQLLCQLPTPVVWRLLAAAAG